MNFTDFVEITDILEEFDLLESNNYIIEQDLEYLDIPNIINTGLDNIKSQNIKGILGGVAIIAKFVGAKAKDIIKLFTNDGFTKIKNFIQDGIIGSEEVKKLTRMMQDPNRYKGYKGLEQYIRDMQEDNPKLFDSLKKAVTRLLS